MESGDTVKISLNNKKEYSGILLPNADKDLKIIKVENGYNIPILKKNIKNIKVISKHKEVKTAVKKHVVTGKPVVALIHTGGTIASKVDYKTGGVHPLFSTDELYSMFPELKELVELKSIHLMDVWSEDFDFSHYNKIGKEIKKLIGKVKGIIVTQGTDTLHFSSSALSFMLEGLNIPVILVASQRSSDRGSTDSALNVLNAAYFITKTDYKGVGICMHASSSDDDCNILHPHNARKMHTSRRDAFRPINCLPLATVNFTKNKIKYLSKYNKKSVGKFRLMPFNEKLKIGLHYHRPGALAEEFLNYEKYDGLVVAAGGLGQISLPPKIEAAIKKVAKKIPIFVSSQCIYGRVDLSVYSKGRRQTGIGMLPSNQGLTTETTYIKLAWILSNFKDVKEKFYQDFRGETILRILENTYLY